MNVDFWTFAKKANSTARPTANPAYTFSCTLKDASGVLRPVLEIFQSQAFNPALLNYARITSYGRYYYVSDWEWVVGRWECTLKFDALASFKTEIGAADKYILRAASAYNSDIIDTFYPTLERVNVSWSSYNFPWYNNFSNGRFVLGVINGEGAALTGTTEYYILSPAELKDFMTYLLPVGVKDWQQYNTLGDILVQSLYDPISYLVSCKYFPFTIGGIENDEYISFGNFLTTKLAEPLSKPEYWVYFQHDYTIPSNWLSRDAKERSEPFAHLCYYLNPFGVVDISTADFTLTDTVRVKVIPDLISGEAVLQIFALINNNEVLVAQQTAMIGFDVNLNALSRDYSSVVSSLIGGAARGAVEIAADQIPLSLISTMGSVMDSITKPTLSASTRGTPSIITLDGYSRLYYRRRLFVDEKNSEFGKPLYENRVINTLSGFIKCGDGDISLDAFPEEVDEISNYLTGGFYYD